MTARAKFTKAEVTRAVKGVQAAGMTVTRIEIEPDGRIVVGCEPIDGPSDWERESAAVEKAFLEKRAKRRAFKGN